MTSRELFREVMFYGDYERMPLWQWVGWEELEREWDAEFVRRGLPADTSRYEYLDAEPFPIEMPINVKLYPAFEEETIEDTPKYRIFTQNDGVVAQDWKKRSCIPHYVDFVFKDRSGWEEY